MQFQSIQKLRWSKVYESPEEELVTFMTSRGITGERLDVAEFYEFAATLTTDTTLWCAEGSMNIRVDDKPFSLQPGDFLRIPSDSSYKATAGMSGCVYYQSH